MVKNINRWKISNRTCNVAVKHFSGAKTNEHEILRHSNSRVKTLWYHPTHRNKGLQTIETPEEITMGIINLAMTCKTDTNSVFISGIDPRSD